MASQSTMYPNLSWAQFETFNDNRTDAFEEMCKDLFICEYLKNSCNPHADHNNPGVEVIPVLEPPRDDGQRQRLISYQAKYYESSISDAMIIESLNQAKKHYSGALDIIYLFCNKIISKNTNRYKKYMDVLGPANIELVLVTDKDIFALLRKHRRVADYYFQDRYRSIASANGLVESVFFVSTISENVPSVTAEIPNVILQELLKSKLEKCKAAICDLKFGEMKSELDLITRIGAETAEKHFYFYRILLATHERQDFSDLISLLPDGIMEEAYWLKIYVKNVRPVSIDEFLGLSVETQVLVLDLMFSSQHWDYIADLYNHKRDLPKEIEKAFDFHFGLSLFNLGEYYKSFEVMDCLYNRYHEQRFKLYSICALLHKANKEFIYGVEEQSKTVKDLLEKLNAVKELVTDQIQANEPLIAHLELQACFNLGALEKQYLNEALIRFEGYSEKAKSNDGVKLFAALCYEMSGDLDKAEELLSQGSWKTNAALASRYMTNLIDQNKIEEVISVFDDLCEEAKTPRVGAVYLLALHRLGKPCYNDELQRIVNRCSESLNDLFAVGFYTEDKSVFDEFILPKLASLIPASLATEDFPVKVGLLAVLAHNNEFSLLLTVLDAIPNLHVINRFVTNEIYICLLNTANKEYKNSQHDKEIEDELQEVERVAERFIKADILRRDFVQIKLLCASAKHMVFSMLKYSKELFEYTHDIDTAKNIIALLYERNETRTEEYEPYLRVLMESEKPNICMVVASVLFKLGRYDEANFFAYKSIYNLNGHDDNEVYKSLFGYTGLTIQRLKEKPIKKSITSNMIVTLEADEKQWIVALDSEDDFGDTSNKSLGVEHLGRTDPCYIKLIGAGINQILKLRETNYKVVSFEPREFVLGRFAFQKAQEHSDEYKGIVWFISEKDPQEMIKQLIALSDNRDRIKTLMDAYIIDSNSMGIPIDFFAFGNYEKYIGAQQYLLYHKDSAYYAGEPRPESIVETKYIPALSTLTLLASKGWLDILDWLGDHLVIPESYISFFREQYAIEIDTQANSAGTFVSLDNGQFTIIEPDMKLPEIWESIISKCSKYPTETVTDEERIGFEVVQGYTWERVFANTKIEKIQLDALIVAERVNGVYLCDDLFFRRIASNKQIKNINTATLLFINPNLDEVMPIIMELSKTNYVYIPFRWRNYEEGKELIQNLLDGEKKKVYYAAFFDAYMNAWDQVVKQLFGDNQNDEDAEL